MVKKVLVGGVFNVVHKGHVFFLKKAKEMGDFLVVVIANDKTAARTKKYAILDQMVRKKNIEKLGIADKVVIGDERDFLKVVREERPDLIVLGYDQKTDEKKLAVLLKEEGITCAIKRIREKLEGYKTSKIIKNNRN
jgi:cytidyltransferase-like protein